MDYSTLRVALIEFTFSKADEPQISYGAIPDFLNL